LCCPALLRACGNHSGEAEHDSGIGLKLFGFIAESVFTFIPESCSRSSRNNVRNHPGIAFTLPRIPHAEKLFNPFYRVRGTEEFAGKGMGLAICHGIVHQLGGHIWVQSEPGKGSTFFFSVRVSPEDTPTNYFARD
jgi:hypothetical protein